MTDRLLDLTGWRALNHISTLENLSIDEICVLIDEQRGDHPFDLALQVFTVAYYRASLEARLHSREAHGVSTSDSHHPLTTLVKNDPE